MTAPELKDISFVTRDNEHFSSDTTKLTRGVNTGALHYLSCAVENIKLAENSTFVICDYGAANASGSFEAFVKIIGNIKKKYGAKQQVMIVYEDLIYNDFNALFRVFKERKDSLRGTNGLFDNVFVMATADSFYNQCVPNNSVHLGFSTLSMHWLSRTPCPMRGFPNSWVETSNEQRDIWVRQAAIDWENILYLRGKELAKGGHMVLQMAGVTETGESGGHTRYIPTTFYVTMNAIFREMCTDGLINEDEFMNTRKNFYSRSKEEVEKPFKDNNSRVTQLGLRLKLVDFKIHRCVFNQQWTDNGTMSEEIGEKSVEEYIQSVRIWNECNWSAGLSMERSASERMKIIDELYRRYKVLVLKDPPAHGYDVVNCTVCIYKDI